MSKVSADKDETPVAEKPEKPEKKEPKAKPDKGAGPSPRFSRGGGEFCCFRVSRIHLRGGGTPPVSPAGVMKRARWGATHRIHEHFVDGFPLLEERFVREREAAERRYEYNLGSRNFTSKADGEAGIGALKALFRKLDRAPPASLTGEPRPSFLFLSPPPASDPEASPQARSASGTPRSSSRSGRSLATSSRAGTGARARASSSSAGAWRR